MEAHLNDMVHEPSLLDILSHCEPNRGPRPSQNETLSVKAQA